MMTTKRTTVRLVRRINAPPSKVFEALTVPDNMLQWWSVDAGHTLGAEADVRPEGRYGIAFRRVDGSEHNPTGVYKEVVPDRKLVFTWEWPDRPEWESLVTIELRPVDIGTELTLTHENLPDEAAGSHEAGWTGLLQQLDLYFGGHR